jgi:hypothetical protein
MTRRTISLTTLLLAGVLASPLAAQPPRTGPPPSIEERTSGMKKIDGYFPLYWDERSGSLYLEIPRFDVDFLFATGLSAGLGSNDIGLDRGRAGEGRVVQFQRVGPRVLLVENNQSFRSSSSNPLERRAVADSFARSILWGFEVQAETGGRVLVNATDFFLRDLVGAARSLRPGTYRVDRTRSAIYLPNTRNFPRNTEVDVTLTFVSEQAGGGGGGGGGPVQGPPPIRPATPGGGGGGGFGGGLTSGTVASVTPSDDAVTLREHASFVELPDGNYTPRAFDPRAGLGSITYFDYSAPITEPLARQFIRRHRLKKKDPAAAISEPVEPIRFWVDPGAPPDIQKAVIEGAMWWNQAFEAAGFRNAFIVQPLPPDADPMDIRYNMINWVHRSTRGWSSGGGITDPRTGEIIKSVVTLGSLRDRQDYLIAEGLLSPYVNGNETPSVPYELAMARIRQLAAHEVGHTLGLGHNYYDSTKGWISVMDYPHMLEELRPDGTIDLSKAYADHIGEWDKVAINYAYREFPPGTNEAAELRRILDEAWTADLRYLTNQDTDVHPYAEQWSNGRDQVEELKRLMRIRRVALDRLGERTIPAGRPMATIEEPLVPIYMYHRYAVEGAASFVGGQDYVYAMRGDGRTPTRWVPAADQQRALDALMATLAPSELTLPRRLLELFIRATGDAFDPIAPARVGADLTIGFLLMPERASRLVAQHALDPSLPGLGEVIDRLVQATFGASAANPYEEAVRRAAARVLVDRVTWIATVSPDSAVRAIASAKLRDLSARLRNGNGENDLDRAHNLLLADDITRFLERPAETAVLMPPPNAPPGAPIGGDVPQNWLAPPPAWCSWGEGQ